jgi:excinuclease ABC subunit C
VGLKRFDRKFGVDFLASVSDGPGIYLFRDDGGGILYVGKAINLRRRLRGYRNASRRKVHRKMRALVREAQTLEVRPLPTERAALLAENEIIRTWRPAYNVDGTYTFLYPMIGLATLGRQTLLAFTTTPSAWQTLHLRWFGAFRSRHRTRDAFDALDTLLQMLGHPEPHSHLPRRPRLRGSHLRGFRRLEPTVLGTIDAYLRGARDDALAALAEALLERPQARRSAARVQEALATLDDFYGREIVGLRDALRCAGRTETFVEQEERDALFLSIPPHAKETPMEWALHALN